MEAFIYRLCYPLWKVGGAASLKRKDPSFITNAASLEYFSPTAGHISDGFSLKLIQGMPSMASLGLIKSIKLPNTQRRKALKEEGKKDLKTEVFTQSSQLQQELATQTL